jgi:hypothetical protein
MATSFHALNVIPGIPSSQVEALAALGFFDAEQLLGAASVEGVSEHFAAALNVSGADLNVTLEAARQVVDSPPAALNPEELPPLGALAPTDAIKAEIAKSATIPAKPPALPPSVNHIALMGPIRDQSARGTCVAFADTAVHELHRRSLGKIEDLSEQFLYHETKKIDGNGGCGTWQIKAVQVLQALGECSEDLWSYNGQPPCNNNGVEPPNARADAANRKCQPVILGPKDVQSAKTLLAAGNAVGFSIPVYDSWYRSPVVARTGRLTMRINNEPSAGGHAMCFVGYADDPTQPGGGYFILRNSWGPQWASASTYGAGYGTIPYAYISNDGWELVSVR